MRQLSPPKYLKGLSIKLGESHFVLLAQFVFNASKQKWLKHEIEHVLNIAKQGDYHHLVKTLRQFSK